MFFPDDRLQSQRHFGSLLSSTNDRRILPLVRRIKEKPKIPGDTTVIQDPRENRSWFPVLPMTQEFTDMEGKSDDSET